MKPTKRIEFLESDSTPPPKPKVEDTEPLDPTVQYPLLARYDFAGKGPRQGFDRDVRMYQLASGFQTRGERIVPLILRIGWVLVRLAIAILILYILIRTNSFNCAGVDYIIRR